MLGIDAVVSDALAASECYQKVFGAEVLKQTNPSLNPLFNEVVIAIYGVQFHLFDEFQKVGWIAPTNQNYPSWFNLVVENATELYGRTLDEGFEIVVPLSEDKQLGVLNAVVKDSFGYTWVIEQIVREISFAERCEILASRFEK